MNRVQSLAPALFVTLTLAAVPALAQGPHSRDPHDKGAAGQASPGSARPANPPTPAQQPQPRNERPAQQAQPRNERPAPPPAAARGDRGAARPAENAAPRNQDRRGVAVPRVTPRIESGRTNIGPRVENGVVVRPPVEVRRFYRPYYSFRPRWSLGFGLWVGYPVTYPYYYPYAVPYPDPNYPNYPYPPGSVNVTPSNIGGLSFDITPSYADVYVDGQHMGTVADFGPTMQPLSLAEGRHYVDIRAAHFAPMVFDVDVLAGQVLPYQGSLRPE
jgi:hypothetical protein